MSLIDLYYVLRLPQTPDMVVLTYRGTTGGRGPQVKNRCYKA